MKAEDKYKQQLQTLGIYDPAFDAEIHQLCILERELSRARKQWAATVPKGQTPSFTSAAYAVIRDLRRDILAHREALGLTPKALRKLRGAPAATGPNAQETLSQLLNGLKEQANG